MPSVQPARPAEAGPKAHNRTAQRLLLLSVDGAGIGPLAHLALQLGGYETIRCIVPEGTHEGDLGGGGGASLRHNGRAAAQETRRVLGRVAGYDHCVILAAAFGFAHQSGATWAKRRMAEIRCIMSMWVILSAASRVDLVIEGRELLTRHGWCLLLCAGLARLRSRTSVRLVRARPEGGLSPEDKAHLAAACPQIFGHFGRIGLSSGRIVNAVEREKLKKTITKREADALLLVAKAAAHLCKTVPLMTPALRAFYDRAWEPGAKDAQSVGGRVKLPAQWTAPDPEIANATGVPISAYMRHLCRGQDLDQRFDLKTREGALAFLAWYLRHGRAHVAGNWVPVGADVRRFLVAREHSGAHLATAGTHAGGEDVVTFAPRNAAELAGALMRVLSKTPDHDMPINAGLRRFLNAPVTDQPGAARRIDLALALIARLPVAVTPGPEALWQLPGIGAFSAMVLEDCGYDLAENISSPRDSSAPARFDLCCLAQNNTGLWANRDMSFRALSRLGLLEGKGLSTSVALHHVNGERIPQSIIAPQFASAAPRLNIGYLLWEFDVIPPEHRLAVDMLDEIWVPSRFVADAYARVSDKPVIRMGKAIDVSQWDASRVPGFSRPDMFTFLVAFDFHSSLARKNPLAAIRAFQAAFPRARKDVRLVIKSTPTQAHHWGDPERQMAAIRNAIAEDERLELVEAVLPKPALLGLIADVDCLVSSHRAEGFGLFPAYAMGLGTPVISTDYSGTQDFCTDKTAFPVAADLVEAAPSQMIHKVDGARWAQVRHSDLVETMRCVERHPSMVRRRALRGKRLIQEEYNAEILAQRYAHRLNELGVLNRSEPQTG